MRLPYGASAIRPASGRTTPSSAGRRHRLRTPTDPRTPPRPSAPTSTRAPQHDLGAPPSNRTNDPVRRRTPMPPPYSRKPARPAACEHTGRHPAILTGPRHFTRHPGVRSRRAPDADIASALPPTPAPRRVQARPPAPGRPSTTSALRPATERTIPSGAGRRCHLRTPASPRAPPRASAPPDIRLSSRALGTSPASGRTIPSSAGCRCRRRAVRAARRRCCAPARPYRERGSPCRHGRTPGYRPVSRRRGRRRGRSVGHVPRPRETDVGRDPVAPHGDTATATGPTSRSRSPLLTASPMCRGPTAPPAPPACKSRLTCMKAPPCAPLERACGLIV